MKRVTIDVGRADLVCCVDGEVGAPVVLLAHGFPDCPLTFRPLIASLVATGYRVVTPFMRGYAPSSVASDGRYDILALAGDLCALAAHFSSGPIRVIGHDWGAVVAHAACIQSPRQFSQLVALSAPHLRVAAARCLWPAQSRRNSYIGLFLVPFLGERALRKDDMAIVGRLWARWSPGFRAPADELAAIKRCFSDEAHARAVLSYYRQLFSLRTVLGQGRRLLFSRVPVPSLYLHGVDDGCIGIELTEGIEAAYSAGIEVHRIESAGHFVHLERPHEVAALVTRFFSRLGAAKPIAVLSTCGAEHLECSS